MSEAEVIEAIGIHGGNAMSAFTVYISFTFGSLMTVYFVGSKLTSFQAAVSGGLYSIPAGAAGLAHIVFLQLMFAAKKSTPTVADNLILLNETFWIWSMSILQIAGILVSLYFMWNVRHAKSE